MTRWPVRVFASPDELMREAAAFVASNITEAVRVRGRGSVAFSGGRTPLPMFDALAELDVDWSKVDVFQVDERLAPDGHPDRNLTALCERLLGRVDGATLHALPVTDPKLDVAARRYEDELVSVCGDPPALDLVHLGLGPDGHTASLFPGSQALDVRDRFVVVTEPHNGHPRMTLTFPVLDGARRVFFLESGREKAAALARVLAGDKAIPAARLRARDVQVFADTEAVADLES